VSFSALTFFDGYQRSFTGEMLGSFALVGGKSSGEKSQSKFACKEFNSAHSRNSARRMVFYERKKFSTRGTPLAFASVNKKFP
jgi:hypothetical protein